MPPMRVRCLRCHTEPPRPDFKFCPKCGHRFGDPLPPVAAECAVATANVRPAPARRPELYLWETTGADVRVARAVVPAGVLCALGLGGDQLWLIRANTTGQEILHRTWGTADGHVRSGEYLVPAPDSVTVGFRRRAGERLEAEVTLEHDRREPVLRVQRMEVLRWALGAGADDPPTDLVLCSADLSAVRVLDQHGAGEPGQAGTATSSDQQHPPTSAVNAILDDVLTVVHAFLSSLPTDSWAGRGLRHEHVPVDQADMFN